MSRMLTTIQGRVLGCLLEKERTTPDQYPLTLNALVLACNQSTSRDPVMHLVDHEVETVLAGLKSETLLRYVHPSHGRSVTRYRQVADEAWALDPPAAALVAVLLLRGPQTVAELRTRTERMHAFESPEAVETVLRELSLRGSVQLLEHVAVDRPGLGLCGHPWHVDADVLQPEFGCEREVVGQPAALRDEGRAAPDGGSSSRLLSVCHEVRIVVNVMTGTGCGSRARRCRCHRLRRLASDSRSAGHHYQ